MLGQLQTCVGGGKIAGIRRIFAVPAGFCLVFMLSGCITADRPDLGIEIPWTYKSAPRNQRLGTPKLDWWRGFRSKELTDLIELAHAGNFDIEIAIARIIQADAASKIAGAPLLPNVALNADATRTRSSQANINNNGGGGGGGSERASYTIALNASYELDFWGKNRAISEAAQE